MSKSGTLKVKNLFKIKSPDKDSKGSPKDGAATSRKGTSGTLSASPGPLSPGDSASLGGDVLPVSPKVKKGKGFLSLRLKRGKSKRKEAAGDVFFPDTDELSSFSSHRLDKTICSVIFVSVFSTTSSRLS